MIERTRSIDLTARIVLIIGVTFILAPLVIAFLTASLSYQQFVQNGGIRLQVGGHFLDQMVEVFSQFVTQLERWMNANSAEAVELTRPGRLQVAGMMGASNAFGATLCLFLGRWWQAALTHPGGFRQEFRALYFPARVALPLLALCVMLLLVTPQASTWAVILAMPLLFSGLSLVHAWAGKRGLGAGWLVLFYGILVVVDLSKVALAALAALDSWYNFRGRWRRGGDGQP